MFQAARRAPKRLPKGLLRIQDKMMRERWLVEPSRAALIRLKHGLDQLSMG